MTQLFASGGQNIGRTLEAKKHVLCEKPIAPNAMQAQKMFDAAKENGVLLMEAFAYLHSPYVSALKQELEQGTIGDVLTPENLNCVYDMNVYAWMQDMLGQWQ